MSSLVRGSLVVSALVLSSLIAGCAHPSERRIVPVTWVAAPTTPTLTYGGRFTSVSAALTCAEHAAAEAGLAVTAANAADGQIIVSSDRALAMQDPFSRQAQATFMDSPYEITELRVQAVPSDDGIGIVVHVVGATFVAASRAPSAWRTPAAPSVDEARALGYLRARCGAASTAR